ncbi:MAG: hypothetical protein R3F35_12140 [Myxococcota bacterium]
MSRTMATWILTGALALGAVPALAGTPAAGPAAPQAQKARLESGLHQLAMRSTTGPKIGATERAEITRQESEIKSLIHRLETGQSVAPSEVDHALAPR